MVYSFVIFWVSTFFHPIHVAITEMEYKPSAKSLQITHKIFTDDLEKHIELLQKKAGKNIRLQIGTPKEASQTDALLEQYIALNFVVIIDGKPITPKLLGKEQETDATWIYMEVENLNFPRKVEITDTFLLDLHEDQQNYVHCKVADKKKSLRFTKGEKHNEWLSQ
jgi:hypothetical protein